VRIIDFVLLALYTTSVSCAIYIIAAHRAYFHERIRVGVVNLFMVAMLFFLSAYTVKMLVVMWIRAGVIFGFNSDFISTLQTYAWTFAQTFTTIGLVSLAVLTYTQRYDLFIYLRKLNREDDEK